MKSIKNKPLIKSILVSIFLISLCSILGAVLLKQFSAPYAGTHEDTTREFDLQIASIGGALLGALVGMIVAVIYTLISFRRKRKEL